MNLQNRFKQIKTLSLIHLFQAVAPVFGPKCWVICERGTDARDNGYCFYRYMKANHPEQKIYYIVDKKSPDYPKVAADAVALGSLKNYWVVASAEKLISTHYATGIPVQYNMKLFRLCGLHKKFYFLQHGVIMNRVPLTGRSAPMRIFFCGAKPEYDFIHGEFGYPDGVVRYTGLARFDQWHDCTPKRQILVMPTWRSYLRTEEQFRLSEYYAKWQGFLGNARLCAMLEAEQTTLIFYAHPEMQPYLHHFSSKSRYIRIATEEDFPIQTLLKQSCVLLTDYSSVNFDFAYMGKPVVYYQFDESTFFDSHYHRGYFDYEKMGFGPVCRDEAELINRLLELSRENWRIRSQYLARTDAFFPLRDKNNCQRIYEAIVEDTP